MSGRDTISNAQAILMEARIKGDTKMTLADAKKKAVQWEAAQAKKEMKNRKKPTAKKKK